MLSIFKKYFAFMGSFKGKQQKGIFFAVLHSLFEAFQLLALAVVLKALIENNVSGTTALLSFGIMLVSIIGTIITGHISHMSEVEGSYAVCADRRIGIGDRMKYMPMGYFNSHSLGNITAAVTTTMADVEEIGPRVMDKTVHGFIHALIIAVSVMIFDWRIGLVIVAGILLFIIINAFLQRKSRKLSPKRQAAQAKLVGAILEYVQGMSVVKSFNLEKTANKTIDKAIADCEKNNYGLEIGFSRSGLSASSSCLSQ